MLFQRGEVWWYQIRFCGVRYRASLRTTNKREAEKLEAIFRTKLRERKVGLETEERKPVPTLNQFAPRFEVFVQTECASSPATVSFYKSKLGFLVKHLGSKRLDKIAEAEIESYKALRAKTEAKGRGRMLSPASINRELATLNRLLRLAQEWKELPTVPKIRLLRGEKSREFVFSREQERLYFAAADSKYQDLHDVGILLIESGIRIGEALKLDWTQVNLDPVGDAAHGHLTIVKENAKGRKERSVPLTSAAVAVLQSRGPAARGLVFHGKDGLPLCQTWLNHQHEQLRRLLRLPADCVPHSFRHTMLTRLGEAGCDAFTIMRIAGHSSVAVSQRYVHKTSGALDAAITKLEALNRVETLHPNQPTAVSGGVAKSSQIQ